MTAKEEFLARAKVAFSLVDSRLVRFAQPTLRTTFQNPFPRHKYASLNCQKEDILCPYDNRN